MHGLARAEGTSAMNAIPYSVFLEVTSACGLNCEHCRWPAGLPGGVELTTGEWVDVIDAARELGARHVVFTGGEPTNRADLPRLVAAASGVGMQTLLATNGQALTRAFCEELQQNGLRSVQVSVDASCSATHDGIRGRAGAFEAAVHAIQCAVDVGLAVWTSMTVTQHNVGDISGVIELSRDLGVDKLKLRRFVAEGVGGNNLVSLDLSPEEIRRVVLDHVLNSPSGALGVEIEQAPFIVLGTDVSLGEVVDCRIRGGCSAGVALCVVDPWGIVRPCPSVAVNVGSVRSQTLREIWEHSPVLDALRDRANLHGRCGSCGFRQHCGGCRGEALARTGDLFGEDPLCWLDSDATTPSTGQLLRSE